MPHHYFNFASLGFLFLGGGGGLQVLVIMSPTAGKLVGGEPWGQFHSGKMSDGGTHNSTFGGKKVYFNAT